MRPRKRRRARTNQRDGQMAFYVDGGGEDKHINYEPSLLGGLQEAPQPQKDYHQHVQGHLGRYQTTSHGRRLQAGRRPLPQLRRTGSATTWSTTSAAT